MPQKQSNLTINNLDLSQLPSKPRIVVLTGAGISAESGVATFRGADGLWEGHRVEDVATPEAFAKQATLVHKFYNLRRRQLTSGQVNPNVAHAALAQLQSIAQERMLLVTQNVDDLHDRLNPNVLHMHGELLRALCQYCNTSVGHNDDLSTATICPNCHQRGGLRPDIVWFSEIPKHMDTIDAQLRRCDIFIAIGTSGHVYPAAGFVDLANYHNALTIEVNIDTSQISQQFDFHCVGPATEQVALLVRQLTQLY